MKRSGMRIMTAALLAVLLAAGCGDGDEPDETPAAAYKVLGGRLVWCAGSLESLTVPDSASSIGNNAFKDCPGLTKVVIPACVTKIGTGTFQGTKVAEVEYKADIAAWEQMLADSKIAHADFPSGITVRCTDGIWKPAAPSEWQITADGVLVRYTGTAADVTIPDGVTAIGKNAFAGCESLAGVDIPASVTGIGAGALPEGTAVTYRGTAERWDGLAEDGGLDGLSVFITDERGTLVGYRGSAADITVPESVTAVAGGVFAGHTELGRAVIPAGVTAIGTGAFVGSGITEIAYRGTAADWDALVMECGIAGELDGITVTCSDGTWTPAHTHDWSETYTDGGDGTHYKTCTGCGEHSDVGAHTWGTPQASDGDGGHYQSCTGCGSHSATEAHQYAYTGSDADSHTMACADCAHTETEPHAWGGEAYTDAGHVKTCAGCGYSETALHEWSDTYTSGDDGHYKTCTTEGCGAHSPVEAHEWGDETHTSAGGHYHTCTAAGCGARSPFEQHTWGGTPQSGGDGGHYQTCTLAGCEARSETVPHGYTYADDGSTTHTMTCPDCAHTKTEPHAWGGETYTDAGHTKTCAGCGHSETTAHDWSAYSDDHDGSHHSRTCPTCNRTERAAHQYGTNYTDNGSGKHYQTCSVCGGQSEAVAHTVRYSNDNGSTHTMTCAANCGYSETEPHAYGGETYTDAGHTKTCAECGHSENTAHEWGATYTDGGTEGHYQSCTTAGCNAYSASTPHDWSAYGDDHDGSHSRTCPTCDRTERGTHTYGAIYTSGGEDGHYKTCADCNAHSATEAHGYEYTPQFSSGHKVTCSACDYSGTEEHNYAYTRTDAVRHSGVCSGCGYTEMGRIHVYSGDACGKCGSPKPVLEGGTIDDNGVLTAYSGSATAVEIPEGVWKIDDSAFKDCAGITSVTIPSGVVSIGANAFQGCTSLSHVVIPDGVTSIDAYTFHGCSSLTDVTIPATVTYIDNYAFQGCTKLANVTIPDGVKIIYSDAFSGCTSLTSVSIPVSVTVIQSYAFYNCRKLTTVQYGGTKAQWEAITKDDTWDKRIDDTYTYTIICTDGSLTVTK